MHKSYIKKVAVLILLFGITGCEKELISESMTDEGFDVSLLEEGKMITNTQCTICHSIDTSKQSPRSDAPPLSTVFTNYNPTSLADDFREHIHVGHPDMPDFNFTVKQTEGLLAYLSSIQESNAAEP